LCSGPVDLKSFIDGWGRFFGLMLPENEPCNTSRAVTIPVPIEVDIRDAEVSLPRRKACGVTRKGRFSSRGTTRNHICRPAPHESGSPLQPERGARFHGPSSLGAYCKIFQQSAARHNIASACARPAAQVSMCRHKPARWLDEERRASIGR
jgi:hypothetical protein